MTARQLKPGRLAGVTLAFAVTYLAFILLGAQFRFGTQQVAAFWPAAGLFLAALMFAPMRAWGPLLLAGVAADAAADAVVNSRSLLPGALFGLGNAGSAVIGAMLLRRVAGISFDLARLRDVIAVVALAALVSPILTAIVGSVTVVTLLDVPPSIGLGLTWWLADAMGILMVTPVLLTWYATWQRGGFEAVRDRSIEGVVLTVSTLAVTWLVFGADFSDPQIKFASMASVVPLYLWAAIRFDPRGVTTVTLLSGLIVVWRATSGHGPFFQVDQSPEQVVLSVQAFLAVVAVCTAVVSTVVTERRIALSDRSLEVKRKQDALDLLERQALIMQSAQSLADFGVWSWNPESGNVEWSDQLYKIYGRDKEGFEPTFEAYLAHVHEEDRERAASNVKAALEAGESVTFTERIVRPDGAVRMLRSSASAVGPVWHRDRRMVGVCLDVTDMAEALQSLEEQEQRLAIAVDAAKMGMWVWSVRSGELIWTDAVYDLFGVDRATFELNYESYLARLHPDDRDALVETLTKALENDDSFEVVHRVAGFDDPQRWIRSYGKISRDGKGKAVRLTGVCFDVSEERSLEERLLHSQKLEAVGTLAGGVAHDFNNMLTGIMGFAELGESDAESESTRGNFTRILELAERASGLTRQLLAFSRRQPLRRRTIELGELIGGMEEMLRRLIGENIGLSVETVCAPTAIRADPNQIEQVIVNLVINARDSLPVHGGKIRITTGCVTMERNDSRIHSGLEEGDYARVAVTDNGRGMDQSTIERIFEPFFTTKGVGKGTGLGLSTAYGIVKQHGGCIDVESEPAAGTTFSVLFPITERPAAEPAEQTVPKAATGSETVLLVEDQDDVRAIVRLQLLKLGYRVTEAANCADAERAHASASESIDLLLSDIVMPDGSGVDLGRKLRDVQPGLSVLFMSGYSREFQELSDEGVEFIPKPFHLSDLADSIRAALDRS